MFQQDIQSCREETRVLRLQDEVVVLVRSQQFDNWSAPRAILKTMLHLGGEVGSPAAEVVVGVNNRHARLLRPALERDDPLGHRQGVLKELVALWEIEVIDDVDQ